MTIALLLAEKSVLACLISVDRKSKQYSVEKNFLFVTFLKEINELENFLKCQNEIVRRIFKNLFT